MGAWGQVFWAVFYTALILIPLSIPRQMSTLRYFSLFGFLCSVYLVLVITTIFFFEHKLIENKERLPQGEAWEAANKFGVTFNGVI